MPPGLAGVELELRHRLGSATVEVHSRASGLLVAHRLAPAGAGTLVRTPEHHAALEKVVLSAFSTERPCDTKANRPPGPIALAEAARLLGRDGDDVIVDLATYQAVVEALA